MTYISSQSFTAPLRSSVMSVQNQLAQAQQEVSSGTPADLGLTLGASTGDLLSLRAQMTELDGYSAGNTTASTRLSTTANVLDSFVNTAQSISSALVTAASAGGSTDTLAVSATGALQGLISGLNTSVAGQSIFGGINTASSPMADYFSATTSAAKSAVDTAFSSYVTANAGGDASTLTAAQMQDFLSSSSFTSQFTGSGWQSSWSSASDSALSTAIAPGETVQTSVSANSTAFQQLAQGYTILTEFTGSNVSSDAQSAAVTAATGLINAGLASLTDLQSTVGVAQDQVDTADAQNTAQSTLLSSEAGDLDSVDTYALSNKVSTLQTQLEASYELTSRLQQLSLTNYLTTT